MAGLLWSGSLPERVWKQAFERGFESQLPTDQKKENLCQTDHIEPPSQQKTMFALALIKLIHMDQKSLYLIY